MRPDVSIESLAARQPGRLPELLGVRVRELQQGRLVAELAVRAELLTPNGSLHAATLVTLADTACGYACEWSPAFRSR
ncbi:PaaI family thioesterase [Mycetohabitans sp. B8]|nr:PaaI family thioesterase [Mycetohabitans sp. B8]